MFFVLSKVIDILLSPFTWGLAFVALAMPWRRPRRRSRWRRRRALGLAGIAVLIVFAMEPVSNRLLYALEHAHSPTYRSDVTYDVVILLGGVSDERVVAEMKQPAYNESAERVIATHRLLADGRARFAIISGAAMDASLVEHGEARVLAQQVVDWGVDASRVILEENARNTRENAVYSKQIVQDRGFEKGSRRDECVAHAARGRVLRGGGDEGRYDVGRLSRAQREDGGLGRALAASAQPVGLDARYSGIRGLYVYRARGYAKAHMQ